MSTAELLPSLVLAGASSFALTALLVRKPGLIPIRDVPNSRSSHRTPKPRTGGVALALAAVLGLAAMAAQGAPLPSGARNEAVVLLGAGAFFLLGFLDDLRNLRARTRLVAQVLLSLAVAAYGARITTLDLPGAGRVALPFAASVALTAFWLTGFTNLFNFMDGVDGYAAGEAAAAGLFLHFATGSPWPLLLTACSLGFLAFNWAPASIFMGDGGSYLLGYLLAAACVLAGAGASPEVPFPALALLFASFIVDAAATLVRRVVRGEAWMESHRSHYYQKLTDLGFSHAGVSGMNLALTTMLGLSALAYASAGPRFRWAILAGWGGAFFLALRWIDTRHRGGRP